MDVGVGWPDEPCEQQCHSLSEGTKVTEFSCGQVKFENASDVSRRRCLVVRYKNLDLMGSALQIQICKYLCQWKPWE